MNRFVLVVAVIAFVRFATIVAGEPAASDISGLVRQLGDGNFDRRLAAEESLVRLGTVAVAALQQASRSDNPEIAFRADRALRAIRLAIPPGTPSNVAHLLRQYRNADPNEQQGLRFEVLLARISHQNSRTCRN